MLLSWYRNSIQNLSICLPFRMIVYSYDLDQTLKYSKYFFTAVQSRNTLWLNKFHHLLANIIQNLTEFYKSPTILSCIYSFGSIFQWNSFKITVEIYEIQRNFTLIFDFKWHELSIHKFFSWHLWDWDHRIVINLNYHDEMVNHIVWRCVHIA
jgi:hypothetical protein